MGKAKRLAAGLMALTGISVGSVSSALLTGAAAQIQQTAIDSNAFSLGTLTPASGSIGRGLWQGADKDTVQMLLASVPRSYDDPYYLELLRRVTLSPGEGPEGADNALAGAKFMAAAEAGFYEDAASLAAIVPGLRSEPAMAKVVAYAELYDGKLDQACARGAGLRDGRTDPFWIKLRFVCYVRTGETSAAELTLDLLRRQSSLNASEEAMFSAMAMGQQPKFNALPDNPLSYALMRESGTKIGSVEALSSSSPAILAAVARDLTQSDDVREAALVKSLSSRTIGYREGRTLIETIPTTALAADLLEVAAQTKGTLEHAESIGGVLSRSRGDWDGFAARSLLLSQELPVAEPVVNFTPAAEELALAAMITGQDAVVEKWVLALSGDTLDPSAATRAATLVELYAVRNPGAARRLGSYLNFSFTPRPVPSYVTSVEAGSVDLSRFVSMGLSAADAGSAGPAALLFLTGQDVAVDEHTASIRDTVLSWARGRADLEWLDREASFRMEAQSILAQRGDTPTQGLANGQPLPSVKPGN